MRTAASSVLVLWLVSGCLPGFDDPEYMTPPPFADPQAGCASGCHGGESSNAPPNSLSGVTETTSVGVGAHQKHLDPASTWHRPVACSDCHVVPADVGSPGHMDDADRKAELTFGAVSGGGMWNGTTCTVGCHGDASTGGTATQPRWTLVDGTQSACGSCHGAPPPSPHPNDRNCASCHPTMEEGSMTFRDAASHINGIVDVVGGGGATGGCTSCHGSTNAAPPKDLDGNTARTAAGVGAHQAHLAPSTWHRAVTCSNCHVVPTTADAPGHRDGDNVAEIPFDTLNPAAAYTPANTTCSTLYCHGNGRANTGTVSWLATGPLACGACHSVTGNGMSGRHERHVGRDDMTCATCHATVVNANLGIIGPNLHINGVHEVKMTTGTWNPATRGCSGLAGGCHGTRTW